MSSGCDIEKASSSGVNPMQCFVSSLFSALFKNRIIARVKPKIFRDSSRIVLRS